MIYAYLAAGAVAVAVGFGSGWQVRAWKCDAAQAEALEVAARDAARRAEKVDVVAVAFEEKRAAAVVKQRVIRVEVDRVVERPVYRNVCLDADGLRLVAESLGTGPVAGQPSPAMPAASSAR